MKEAFFCVRLTLGSFIIRSFNLSAEFVSIILPVYNGEPYLSQAISSIISQSHKNFELLIIDDGSTDSSLKTVQEFSRRDARIKYWTRGNRGLGATLNELICNCSSEYIARMDADDICEADRVALQYKFLSDHAEVGMVGGQIRFLVNQNVVRANPMPLDHLAIRSALLEARFPICHPSIMFRKSLSRKIGGYRISGAGEDLDFFLRASEVAYVRNIPEFVLRYRMHLNSLNTKKSMELHKAYSFSVENAHRRLTDAPELTFSEYAIIWQNRSILTRLIFYIKSTSEILYRKAIIARGTDQRYLFFIFIICAGFFRPRIALNRFSKKMLSILKK